jgi:phi LC3 family holin
MINWKVRIKNPYFWGQIALTIIVTIIGYAGISGTEITTWKKLFDLIAMALSNPYCLFLVVVSVINAINDPTTKGLKDSMQALTYEKPKEDK